MQMFFYFQSFSVLILIVPHNLHRACLGYIFMSSFANDGLSPVNHLSWPSECKKLSVELGTMA